jgi:hypothetical protein
MKCEANLTGQQDSVAYPDFSQGFPQQACCSSLQTLSFIDNQTLPSRYSFEDR